jgi:hypothetical protein
VRGCGCGGAGGGEGGKGVRAAKAKGGRVRGAGEQAGTYITNRRVGLQVGVCADFYSYLLSYAVMVHSALRPQGQAVAQRLQCTQRGAACPSPEVCDRQRARGSPPHHRGGLGRLSVYSQLNTSTRETALRHGPDTYTTSSAHHRHRPLAIHPARAPLAGVSRHSGQARPPQPRRHAHLRPLRILTRPAAR